ncbi:MAG: hypothetical protein AAGC81_12010 [Pseudomonadota bacterium]
MYSYDFHWESMLAFIRHLNLSNTTLVCQDWGGVLGLTLLMEMPDRFKRFLIMKTGLMAGPVSSAAFEEWKADIVSNPNVPVEFVMQKNEPIINDAEAAAYAAQFCSGEWQGESFMAIGMTDKMLGPDVMNFMPTVIRECPKPLEIAEGGHVVQESGGLLIAERAMVHFGLLKT